MSGQIRKIILPLVEVLINFVLLAVVINGLDAPIEVRMTTVGVSDSVKVYKS